jgi:hypothetical protein
MAQVDLTRKEREIIGLALSFASHTKIAILMKEDPDEVLRIIADIWSKLPTPIDRPAAKPAPEMEV